MFRLMEIHQIFMRHFLASNAILFDNSNSTIQERTAYWAVNEVHDHLKNIFPNFTWFRFYL